MSRIDAIESISDRLAATSIAVVPKRCVYIRNWHSTCKHCQIACQHDAIERSIGHLSVNFELCTECGACTCACPTSALLTSAPAQAEIVRQARVSAELNAGSAAFICERHANEIGVDPERVVVLPCLDYLDEYLIAGMFALKFKRVVLLAPSCEGCDRDCEQPYFEHMVASARNLLDLWNVQGTFATLEEVPSTLVLDKPHAKSTVVKSDRREAFGHAGATAIGAAINAVTSVMDSASGKTRRDADEQIVMRPEERFPADSYRSVRLLHALDSAGTHPYGATVDTRFWASVDVNPVRCKHCGICARMCVTQALKYEVDEEDRATLTFQPSLCVNCRLCKDSCLSHSMIYTTKVPADELDGDFVKELFKDEQLTKADRSRLV